nr:GNAT family N-acetyltransferase [Clostridia bacterium]
GGHMALPAQETINTVYRQAFPNLPVTPAMLERSLRLSDPAQTIQIRFNDKGAPIAACVYNDNGIGLLAVVPEHQNEGLGSALLRQAEDALRQRGATRVALGCAGSYLFPGVPECLPGVSAFFEHRGYRSAWTCVDLTMDLTRARLPDLPSPSLQAAIRPCAEADRSMLLDSVAKVEPHWVDFYAACPSEDILIAIGPEGIVGFVQLLRSGIRMEALLPGRTGGLGCLGVLPGHRERGIGLNLANAATRTLQRAGFDTSYIGYTWLEDWYGRLGYRRFLSYWMGEKALA